jgi:hypothetical protein
MLRLAKPISCLGLVLALNSAQAFSLLGPNNEAWQVPDIGYNPLPQDALPTAPKNIGEEYRRNTPILYYSFDATFLDFFGSNGVWAVDQAMSILNSLTNVSSYSPDLTEFPTAVTRENYRAEALFLLDLKSQILHLMVEQLGLAEPERYVWTLHNRFQVPGAPPCPLGMEYLIVKRNFAPNPSRPDQYQTSSYVNGTLYSYYILEVCQGQQPLAEAIEFSVDPLDTSFTAVASAFDPAQNLNSGLAYTGKFYTGLTRDDIAGLRYLLRTNNLNWESSGPNTLTQSTNPIPQILYTSNLTTLAQQALVTDPATLQGLYPNLLISNSSNYFVTVWVTNAIPYFTNYPFDPAGTPPHIAFTTNRTQTIQTRYTHNFANISAVVITNGAWGAIPVTDVTMFTNQDVVTLQTVTVAGGNSPFTPPNATNVTFATNVTSRTLVTNQVTGEFFILPTNICDVAIIAPQLTFVDFVTNLVTGITNNTGTNFSSYEQFLIDRFTNHAFLVYPVLCQTSSVSLVQGIEQIKFVRRDFDSLLGQFFTPVTNTYTLNTITNYTLVPQKVIRTAVAPDFLFSAADFAPGPNTVANIHNPYVRTIAFSTNGGGYYPGLAGPGTIDSPTAFLLNKVGPIYENASPDIAGFNAYSLTEAEATQIPLWTWGTFDASTNAPIVYPNGTSLDALESMILMQVSPGLLPEGSLAATDAYNVQLSITGAQAPIVWSLSPTSPGLPPGLTLSPDGVISGMPLEADIFDFVVRMTDAQGRVLDRSYSLTINP